jgi:hypothetical protein
MPDYLLQRLRVSPLRRGTLRLLTLLFFKHTISHGEVRIVNLLSLASSPAISPLIVD